VLKGARRRAGAAPRTRVQGHSRHPPELSIFGVMNLVMDYLLRWFETVSAEIRASLEPVSD
jgi:hypothetical protein